MNFQSKKVKVNCRIGARHASNISLEAQKLKSVINISKDDDESRRVNMKSTLGLLSLSIYPCDKVVVNVSNENEEQAKEDSERITYYLKNL